MCRLQTQEGKGKLNIKPSLRGSSINFCQCESLNKDKPERTWVEGGLQEKCAKCEKYGHKCGPPQYPSEQSPLEPGNGNQLRRRVSAVAPSLEQQHSVISPVDRSVPGTRLSGELEEDKLELQRKLVSLIS